MDLNLEPLKREILAYLDASEFAVFHSSPGGLDALPMVLWDVERFPDYQMFLEAARKAGIKLILFASCELDAAANTRARCSRVSPPRRAARAAARPSKISAVRLAHRFVSI